MLAPVPVIPVKAEASPSARPGRPALEAGAHTEALLDDGTVPRFTGYVANISDLDANARGVPRQ